MSDKDGYITYVARVFDADFIIEAKGRPQVRAHLVRRLRKEVTMRVADFADGVEAERLGLPTERADGTPEADDEIVEQTELLVPE
jgi:hypothetical protein